RGRIRVIFGDSVGQYGVLAPERDRSIGWRAQSGERLLKCLACDARIEVGRLVAQCTAVVLSQGLRRIAELPGCRIEERLQLEYTRPVAKVQRLRALQADPGLAQIVRRNTGNCTPAVLL